MTIDGFVPCCQHCGSWPVFATWRCRACYEYRRKHGVDRSPELLARAAQRRYRQWQAHAERARIAQVARAVRAHG